MRAVSECFFAIYSIMSNHISFKQQLRGERSQQMRYFRFTCLKCPESVDSKIAIEFLFSPPFLWLTINTGAVIPCDDTSRLVPFYPTLIPAELLCEFHIDDGVCFALTASEQIIRYICRNACGCSFIYCMCLWSPKLSFTSLTWFMLFFVSDHLWSGQR